jgi:hypothetical protein
VWQTGKQRSKEPRTKVGLGLFGFAPFSLYSSILSVDWYFDRTRAGVYWAVEMGGQRKEKNFRDLMEPK